METMTPKDLDADDLGKVVTFSEGIQSITGQIVDINHSMLGDHKSTSITVEALGNRVDFELRRVEFLTFVG